MSYPRIRCGIVGAISCLLVLMVTLVFSRAAAAGTPDHQSHFSTSGDPDNPTGELGDPDNPMGTEGDPDNPMVEQGDPDYPTGKKNGASPLMLTIERMSRTQVRIHVAFLGDPDNPTGRRQALHGSESGWHLSAYDVTGRLRRQWDAQGVLAQGGNVTWDMKDDRGTRMASGIYFVRFSGMSSAVTQRIIALR